jgi:hypothetical protein
MTSMSVLVLLLAAVVALLAVVVAGLLRSHAEILRTLQALGARPGAGAPSSASGGRRGPTTGRPASDVSGTSPGGDALAVAVLGVEHPTLLAFLTSTCTTCMDFWNAFADPAALRIPGGARLVIVTQGEEAESAGRVQKLAPRAVPVVMSSLAWSAYDVAVAPYFVFVDGPSATIVGEGGAANWRQLRDMLSQALAGAGS